MVSVITHNTKRVEDPTEGADGKAARTPIGTPLASGRLSVSLLAGAGRHTISHQHVSHLIGSTLEYRHSSTPNTRLGPAIQAGWLASIHRVESHSRVVACLL